MKQSIVLAVLLVLSLLLSLSSAAGPEWVEPDYSDAAAVTATKNNNVPATETPIIASAPVETADEEYDANFLEEDDFLGERELSVASESSENSENSANLENNEDYAMVELDNVLDQHAQAAAPEGILTGQEIRDSHADINDALRSNTESSAAEESENSENSENSEEIPAFLEEEDDEAFPSEDSESSEAVFVDEGEELEADPSESSFMQEDEAASMIQQLNDDEDMLFQMSENSEASGHQDALAEEPALLEEEEEGSAFEF